MDLKEYIFASIIFCTIILTYLKIIFIFANINYHGSCEPILYKYKPKKLKI